MKHYRLLVIILFAAILLFSAIHATDAGISNFTQMMYSQLIATNKDPHLVTRVYEPAGRASGNVGDTDVRLVEVGADYFCGMHSNGWRECWRDADVVSVAFFVVH